MPRPMSRLMPRLMSRSVRRTVSRWMTLIVPAAPTLTSTLAVTLLATPAIALLAVPFAAPALADEVTGTVVAHDRVAHRVIMDDRTIYEYDPAKTVLPRAILAGDRIRIDFRGGEDGIEAIDAIEIVTPGGDAPAEAASDG